MKRFQFSLRPVAVMRAHRELLAREALAAALAAHRETEERLAAARGRLSGLEALIRESRQGSFRAAEAVAVGQAYRRACGAEAEALKQVAASRAALEKRRSACVEANRDLKAVAKVEEKARARHQDELQHAAQAELDEIAVRRASRRRHIPSSS